MFKRITIGSILALVLSGGIYSIFKIRANKIRAK